MSDLDQLRAEVAKLANAVIQLELENGALRERATMLEARALRLEKHSQDQNTRIASLTTHAQVVNQVPIVKKLVRDHFEEKAERKLRAPAPAYQGDPIFRDYQSSLASDGGGDKWGGR